MAPGYLYPNITLNLPTPVAGATMGPIIINLGSDKKILKELKAQGATLLNMLELLSTIQQRQEQHMSQNKDDFDALSARIDAATNAIATRIQALTDQIGTGMSQAEVDAVKAALGAEATKLEAMESPQVP